MTASRADKEAAVPPGAVAPGTIGERLHARAAALTKSERRLARILFSSNLMAGFDTVGELARRCSVSGPTVLRFTAKLGFDSYPQFQRALKADIAARLSSPLSMYGHKGGRDCDPLSVALAGARRGLAATLRVEQAAEFEAIVTVLCAAKHRVFVRGGRFTRLLAELLWAHLYQLRPEVHLVTGTAMNAEAAALSFTRSDVLVVFDMRRYQLDTIAFAQFAHDQGARVVLVTDPWLSPAADFSDRVLTCDVESSSPFDSLVPCLSLVEALVGHVAARLDGVGKARVARLESVREKLGDAKSAPHRGARRQSRG